MNFRRRRQLLLAFERSATNLVLWSQTFSNAVWAKAALGTGSAAIVTDNFATAPDGTTTAARIQFNTGAGVTSTDASRMLQSGITISNATAYSTTFYARTPTGTVTLTVASEDAISVTNFTITTSWQRFTLTHTSTATAGRVDFKTRGDIQPGASEIYLWGSQLETGTSPSSYIPTTTAPVTRPAG